MTHLQLAHGRTLDLSTPKVMGILNVTPDSFSDGGAYFSQDSALEQAQSMLAGGVDIIDIGGESTRPGAEQVDEKEELNRVLPVVEALAASSAILSIDTSKPAVMRAAISAGAHMVNDVAGLRADGALEAVAQTGAAACIMHMQGAPRTMQEAPHYHDVVSEVRDYLANRLRTCESLGICSRRLLLDPGFGFGKSLQHNLALFQALPEMAEQFSQRLLVGVSRKSMLGALTNTDVDARILPSVIAALRAAQLGAKVLRVHDVAQTVNALKLLLALDNKNTD